MSSTDYDRAYPPESLRQRLTGRGVVDCAIAADGKPEDCRVVQEEPAGLGFGESALKLARYFRFRPRCPGESARVTIPITFNLP
jgi:protein TonB